ncbi:MAG: helix-turn-helix domain-containing protein [Syntrophaceae bacterium]|nr:helix-turn-helix domain-containing protein [Syntrophaceae bacterium]
MSAKFDEPLLAIKENEAAHLMKMSVQTLRNHRTQGKGCPYLKIGRSVRYSVADIEKYLERCRVAPGGE